ncbi:MAG: hypothetical protein B7Z22_03585 [Hyphomonas sp. 32-62-5]|nr:MAG: hypothetical protein B7Z22_03585 [Hyphomonas sp. 32-62-5]
MERALPGLTFLQTAARRQRLLAGLLLEQGFGAAHEFGGKRLARRRQQQRSWQGAATPAVMVG